MGKKEMMDYEEVVVTEGQLRGMIGKLHGKSTITLYYYAFMKVIKDIQDQCSGEPWKTRFV